MFTPPEFGKERREAALGFAFCLPFRFGGRHFYCKEDKIGRKNIFRALFFLVAAGLTLFPQSLSAGADELLIYCGASLKNPINEIAELFEDEHDVEINYIFGGSGTLLGQIESKEEGDAYMPGGMYYFEQAQDERFIEYEEYVAYHTPVIAVQEGNPKHIDSLDDLAGEDVEVALGDPEKCAIGRVTEEILENTDIADEVYENTEIYAMTNTELVELISEEEADAVIVWQSSLFDREDETDVVEISEDVNEIDIIPIGTLTFSEDEALAKKFVDSVALDFGRGIFKDYGFTAY